MSEEELPLLLLGAGGHAKVLVSSILRTSQIILGVVTPELTAGSNYLGLPVIGEDGDIAVYAPRDVLLINGVGSLPGQQRRCSLYKTMRARGYRFGKVVDPTSIVATNVILGEGIQVMAGSILQPGCQIGLNSIINTGSLIDHDCVIGDHCHIAPGVTLSGDVNVGNYVHIGTGAQVIQGVRIGDHAVIAAGTTVYKDVPKGLLIKQQAIMVMEEYKR
jgi:sugar O-acyltransferase (sialic acid O-acetyltransferase NeuD family)